MFLRPDGINSDPEADREPDHPLTRQPADAVTCALCGATAESLPLGWSTAVERGRKVAYCERCSRENVRAMEGKLDPEFW